jgi:ribonuclease J
MPLGRFVVTGDWKLDQTPMYEPVMDLQTFAEFGRDGTVALFGDSTNAEVDGFSTSEYDVYRNVKSVAEDAPGRVIVAQFSSNVHRLHSMLELAYEQNRKVLLLGRSLRDNFDLALESGDLELPDSDLMIKPHQLGQLPDERVLILSTGSQAEPRASLSRMSHGDHHHVSIRETDTVVISARAIPGNQRGIQTMIDDLTRRGAEVIHATNAPVHGSGHACAEELKLMANLTEPEYLVPVHGHYRMRKEHAKLGREVGVPEQKLIENGDVLEFTRDGAHVAGRVETGRVLIDGTHVWDLEEVELRKRAELAESGIVVAHAVVDKSTGELAGPPELVQRGFLDDEPELVDEAVEQVQQAIESLSSQARRDSSEVEGAIRRSIRKFFRERVERQPVAIPVVHEV